MGHIIEEDRLEDHNGCSETKIRKSKKKKKIIGLSVKGESTDKNLELTKEFHEK